MLDLKIATAALAEMRDTYEIFKPYKNERKVSIFGSARILNQWTWTKIHRNDPGAAAGPESSNLPPGLLDTQNQLISLNSTGGHSGPDRIGIASLL